MTETVNESAPRMRFATPEVFFRSLDAQSTGSLVAGAADVALVLSAAGEVLDVAFSDASLAKTAYRDWMGRRFSDIVTAESRPKIDDLLRDAAPGRITRWRQVNHPLAEGPDVPVRYATIRLAEGRNVLAVGRDLRALATSQARLMEQTQAMEREYARIRDAEKRYRLLFQMTAEPSLIVDAGAHRIVEVNPAATALFGLEAKRAGAGAFEDLFAPTSRSAAQSFLAAARVAPRIDNVHVEIARDGAAVLLSGSMFRQDSATLVIVLISRLGGATRARPEDARRLAVLEAMPEPFVVTDPERRVVSANAAFVDLVQIASEAQTLGEPLDRWIGRQGVDLDVLYANLKTHGVVRRFSTLSRGEFGTSEDVEIAAASALDGAQTVYGFTIRRTGEGAGLDRLGGRELPRTVEQFADLVGRVPLKNLVRETTDLIERLCIEAALELTKDNRASAAEMLGLSRQGFYAKLRRYGLGDLDGEDERPEMDN
jgi:transcriptional regulator PpsR